MIWQQNKRKIKRLMGGFLLFLTADACAVEFTINGKIYDRTCDIKTDHKNLVVRLPTISKYHLQQQGDTAGRSHFRIELENCKLAHWHQGKQLYAFFVSQHIDESIDGNGTLSNVAKSNRAENVNIQLTNADGSAIYLTNDKNNIKSIDSYQKGVVMNASRNAYTLDYAAQYYAKGKASAGQVESFAVFMVEYK